MESAFDVLVKAREIEATGRSVIHLEIGEPDFDTPAAVIEAAKVALDEGWTHYGPTQGLPELRETIASYVSRTRGIKVDAQNVCVVPGGKPIMFFTMLALLEPGDEVLYPDPGFPIYRSMVRFLEATPVPIPLVESRAFTLDLDYLRDHLTPRTKMLILNSPQNPTGGIIPESDVREIAEMVRDRDLMILDRRDLFANLLLRQRAVLDREHSRNAGEGDHSGWILEDLCHDRMAAWIRRDARLAGRGGQQADGEFEFVQRELYAARRHHGTDGTADRGRSDGG